ncbi:hypothetical protein F5883DRAFT_623506 [Diaporthe sp. PMI_573]|nr:hypothetical protein F5883DRAFT_623506 [Diaporthaceae sp. PMI_573]
MPELNIDQDSIMVASDDPECLDKTNQFEESSIEEPSAFVPNAPAKKSKGRIGRPAKRRSVDAHSNTDRTERPGKRSRPGPTLDKRTQNGDITANQEMTAESPTPELPFRPEDLEKLLSPVDESQLNGDFVDTIVQHLVACNRHVTAIPGRAWAAVEPGENTLPCDASSIFILPVNINERLASMAIHVAERKAMLPNPLMDKQVKKDHQEIQRQASLFVSNCLPQPYNNWDERWTTQLDTRLQQCDSRDSGIYYTWVAMHIASGLQLPSSFDGRLVRCFIYAIFTNINRLAGACATPGVGNRNSDTPETLWEVFSSTNLIQSDAFGVMQNAGDAAALAAAAFANDNSRRVFLQRMMAEYKDIRVSELKDLEALVDHLVLLIDEFCASSTMWPGDQNELDNDEAALRRIDMDATSLRRTHLDVKDMVNQQLRYIAEQKRRSAKCRWLQEASRLVDVPGAAKRLRELREQVKETPVQASIQRRNAGCNAWKPAFF